jgi:hypothetical protein
MNLNDNRRLQEINAEKQKFLEVIKLRSHPGFVEILTNVMKMRDDVALNLKNESEPEIVLPLHSKWVFACNIYDYLNTVSDVAEHSYYEAFGVSSDADILVNS